MTNRLSLPPRWFDQAISVFVAGAGGTGSQVLDQLASLDALMRQLGHPGFRITAYDGDTVSRFNLGRQRFAAPDVGLNKSIVLCHRLRQFYGTDIRPEPLNLSPHHAGNCDLLVTCTDSASFRAAVGRNFAKHQSRTLWLDFGNGNQSAQCVLGHLGQTDAALRIPNVFDLFPQLAALSASDHEQPSCSMEEAVRRQPWPANRSVAIAGMTLVERLLRHGELDYHGNLIELNPYCVQPLAIDPVTWGMYGYSVPPAPKATRRKAA